MMKRKLLILILAVLTVLCIFAPVSTLADDDDFEVSYDFAPDPVGYLGADIELMLDITNTGPTNITWVDVVVNTQTTFSERWTGTITPGASRTLSFHIPFAQDDLNVEKILQVSMNNNISANPDGIYMDRFEIEGITDIFDVAYTVTPEQAVYYPGDTVTVTTTFTNSMPRGTALDMRTDLYMTKGTEVFAGGLIEHGNVLPGDTVSSSKTHTFEEDDAGATLNANYYADFDLFGKHYTLSGTVHSFDVGAPEAEIDFTAHLGAHPTEIDAGDTVTFNVDITNTGSDTIATFEVRNAEGGLEASTEHLNPGDMGTVSIDADIYESTDVSYVVVGRTGDDSQSQETNAVHITVRSDAAPTVTPSPTPAVTPDDVPAVTPIPLETDAAAAVTTDDADTTQTEVQAAQGTPPTLLLIVLGVIGLLILAAIVVLIIVLGKNKQGKKNGKTGDRNSL